MIMDVVSIYMDPVIAAAAAAIAIVVAGNDYEA